MGVDRLRTWWQKRTGEEETPFDGGTPVWVVSMVVHLALMLLLAFLVTSAKKPQTVLTISAPVTEQSIKFDQEQFVADERPRDVAAVENVALAEIPLADAPAVPDVSDIPSPHVEPPSKGRTADRASARNIASASNIDEAIQVATAQNQNKNFAVKGEVRAGTSAAGGTVDRIAHEIMLSLEERPTLVVWMFDQTASLIPQRTAIFKRFDKIYQQLGVVAGGKSNAGRQEDKPLLTAVVGFGQKVNFITKRPTDDLTEIQSAVVHMPTDNSGMEQVFSAIYMSADKYKDYRLPDPATGKPRRNVLLIAFTDEAGSDQDGLDKTVQFCRRYEMPVYIVGVPAPFGRKETLMKWVDPDPQYNQEPQWGVVEQGPESLLPERLKLDFSSGQKDEDSLDSGFGPYSLTRLCYETGGIYFAVHPNRGEKAVSRNETAEFAAHLAHFFDPQIMRKYRPDYVSAEEYKKRIAQNKARAALVQASQSSLIAPVDRPESRFVKRDEASFSNALSEAQKGAAKLEPAVNALYDTLKLGEADRPKESVLRWQAGYDLAMGRVMAIKVRTETYNAMLAAAKRGLKFKDEKNNTWVLQPSDEISVGSQSEKMAAKAKEYLQRVLKEHPGTPWALLAERELETPLGFTWSEQFTDLNPPARMAGGGGGNNAPANDAAVMLKKGAPKRPPPKL